MSTEFIIHKEGLSEVAIDESSARFSLDLWGFDVEVPESCGPSHCEGPQNMEADETLRMAAKIIYAVWCNYPDKADKLAKALAEDIPNGSTST